jgi:hypothetical protein
MDRYTPVFYDESAEDSSNKHKLKIVQEIIQEFGVEFATKYSMSIFFALEKPDMPSEVYHPGNWATEEYAFEERKGRILVSNVAIKELSDLAFRGLGLKSLSLFYVLARAPIESPKIYKEMLEGKVPIIALDIGSEISGARRYPNKPMAAFRIESWNYEYNQKNLDLAFCRRAMESFGRNVPDYENLIRKGINFKI